MLERELTAPREARRGQFPRTRIGVVRKMRRGFCTLVLLVLVFIMIISFQLTVQCRRINITPSRIVRGSVTNDSQFAYFTPLDSTSVFRYEFRSKRWSELPPCLYRNSGLVIIHSELTAIGGHDEHRRTSKILSLRQRKWVKLLPPMSTALYCPAVFSIDGDYLFVIGGYVGDDGWTSAVEFLQVKSRKWSKLTHLPQPLRYPSAILCGNKLSVIGIDNRGYSCSLEVSSSCDQPFLIQCWKRMPSLPVTASTAATINGQLLIIGGMQSGFPVKSIYQLIHGQWVEIGSMANCRSWCLVATPSLDKIIIVGGAVRYRTVNDVEECILIQ